MTSDRNIHLNGKEPVSMNVWGFTPDLFGYLESMFIQFLKEEGGALKSEYLIPSVVNNLNKPIKNQYIFSIVVRNGLVLLIKKTNLTLWKR